MCKIFSNFAGTMNKKQFDCLTQLDELTISPELQRKIEKARKERLRGETLAFHSAEAAIKWMETL